MGVWDPERFRGWSGGTRDRFTLAPSDATPGYLTGALPAGRWQLMLGVPNARANSRAAYRVTVDFDRAGSTGASQRIADAPLNPASGWYRGDFHMHDANSDGSCSSQSGKRVPCPLFRTVEAAAKAGLDFAAVTDHNTTAHFGGLRELQPYFDRTLLIPGTEITTFGGHANIFGERRFVDFRVGAAVPDIAALTRDVAAAGAILSINHPALPSGEACMELHRRGFAHSIECWDGDRLAGGLYGLALGKAFFGESMVTRVRDASKVAFAHLVARLKAGGFTLLDCQFQTGHLATLGAVEVPRDDYVVLLGAALGDSTAGLSVGAPSVDGDFSALERLPEPPPAEGAGTVSGPLSRKVIAQLLGHTS